MKKLIFAILIALTATTASAGRVFVINNGAFDVEYYWDGMDNWNRWQHNTGGKRHLIHYENGKSIAFRAKWTGMQWINVTIKPDTDIILDFYGTIFSPQVNITEEHYPDIPVYDGRPFKCHGCTSM